MSDKLTVEEAIAFCDRCTELAGPCGKDSPHAKLSVLLREQAAEVERLKAENAALQADKERLDWLSVDRNVREAIDKLRKENSDATR